MSDIKAKILIADDEPFNLDILSEYLGDKFDVTCADDGDTALAALQADNNFDVIVLDRMMPRMNGIEVLKSIKQQPSLASIPVIMQTAAASSTQVQEGLNEGVYYYLAKPYNETLLLSIIYAALRDAEAQKRLSRNLPQQKHVLGMMSTGCFRFRTLEDVTMLAHLIAGCFPAPDHAVYGLYELMLNAVEHGNLGITYDEKLDYINAQTWRDEVDKRLQMPENQNKSATLTYEATDDGIEVRIKDCGIGFNWKEYIDFAPLRSMDPNGRGIALTRVRSFPNLQYIGNGNEVVIRHLNKYTPIA